MTEVTNLKTYGLFLQQAAAPAALDTQASYQLFPHKTAVGMFFLFHHCNKPHPEGTLFLHFSVASYTYTQQNKSPVRVTFLFCFIGLFRTDMNCM